MLLPEMKEKSNGNEEHSSLFIPKTENIYYRFIKKAEQHDCIMNVYGHFRNFFPKKKALCLSAEMLTGFDEIWYSAAFGVNDIMLYLLKKGKSEQIPIHAFDCLQIKQSFTTVYQIFVNLHHPTRMDQDHYWDSLISTIGQQKHPLTMQLCCAVLCYFEEMQEKKEKKVIETEQFKEEFRLSMNFAKWVLKDCVLMAENIDPKRICEKPSPMLIALVTGFQKYYATYLQIQQENQLQKQKEDIA